MDKTEKGIFDVEYLEKEINHHRDILRVGEKKLKEVKRNKKDFSPRADWKVNLTNTRLKYLIELKGSVLKERQRLKEAVKKAIEKCKIDICWTDEKDSSPYKYPKDKKHPERDWCIDLITKEEIKKRLNLSEGENE